MSSSRIANLDGIRGIAILMVLLGHTAQNYQPLNEVARRWLMVFANSSGGVRLFFVLSGYLITGLLLREYPRTSTLALGNFYWRRIVRIFPAFYVFLAAVYLLSLCSPTEPSAGAWFAAATFTWNYGFLWMTVSPALHWNLGHLWTLALEEQFYLVWPLILLLARPRRAFWVAVALIAWCPLARVATYFIFPAERGYIGMMAHTAMDSLMVGCAVTLLMQSPAWRTKLLHAGATLAGVSTVWLLLISPVVGELVHGFPAVAGLTLDAIAAGGVIAWVHYGSLPGVDAFLGRGLLPILGVISYSLYLWQQLFLSPSGPLASGRVLWPWLGALAAATASYWLVERPTLRFKDYWVRARTAVTLPSV
ncbi:MAG: acyltransferase [Opitutaceae bacterium]